MHISIIKKQILVLTLGIALLASLSGQALSEKVGVTAAVNPEATAKGPGQSVRQLKIGSEIIRNERVQTSSSGSTQVIFIDGTTLTISPNSDITINEFVFNSQSKSLSVTLGKGLMRFVGGELSHSGNVQIKTQNATMGIRGGMGLFNKTGGTVTAVNLFGSIKVTTPATTVTLSRPGLYSDVKGATVSTPAQAPPGMIASFNARLASRLGQTAGSKPGLVTSDKVKSLISNYRGGNNPTNTANNYQSNVQFGLQGGQGGQGGQGIGSNTGVPGGGPTPPPTGFAGPPGHLIAPGLPGQLCCGGLPPGQALQGAFSGPPGRSH